jgi:hypothetical protein
MICAITLSLLLMGILPSFFVRHCSKLITRISKATNFRKEVVLSFIKNGLRFLISQSKTTLPGTGQVNMPVFLGINTHCRFAKFCVLASVKISTSSLVSGHRRRQFCGVIINHF